MEQTRHVKELDQIADLLQEQSCLRATLAARDAEIQRLKDKAIRFDLDQIGIESRERDAVELVEARAEIERLKAELATREKRCEERCMGYPAEDVRHWIAQEAFDRERALREKRERQLDLFRQMAEKINSLSSERLGEPMANAILGLLAAIDEATNTKENA